MLHARFLGVPSELGARRGRRAVRLSSVLQGSGVIPGTCTIGVRALVASELVDEDASVIVQVRRALAAARRAACRNRRAIRLIYVLQSTGLVVPGAGTPRVRALIARVDVDEYACAVTGEVGGAFTVTTTAVARKRDRLAGE